MRRINGRKRPAADAASVPFDAVALPLAVWLGLMVAVGGLARLSEAPTSTSASHVEAPQASFIRPLGTAYAGY